MMATMTARLSGKAQDTMTVEGIEVNGFFVHHSILIHAPNGVGADWTVSHSQSGQNLGARFSKRKDALQFARDMASTYDGHCDPEQMFEQFRGRGSKPSCADLAKRNNAIGL